MYFGSMYEPPLDLLRQVVDPSITGAAAVPIKRSSTPATVYRVTLSVRDHAAPATVIVKRTEPGWPDDPLGHRREALFFDRLFPRLCLAGPRVYYSGSDPDDQHCLIVMEDLADNFRFPPPRHLWTQVEIGPIVTTYATLHHVGEMVLPPPAERQWLVDRHESRVMATAGELPEMARELARRGVWPELPQLTGLLENVLVAVKQFANCPVTVLHNDVYPPNIGLARQEQLDEQPAVLLDWDMVGWGLAEMDLAFMFLQPYGSHRRLDRAAALDRYWSQRAKLAGSAIDLATRQARQAYADALWAVWLMPVAFRMVTSPFPPGTGVRQYWDSMLPILGERLAVLSHGV
jgi:hypothetical protein